MQPVIDFIVDGEKFAMRDSWEVVPRVGDVVILKHGEVWAEVTRVFWSDDTAPIERQWIQLVCKSIPNQTQEN